MMNKEHICACPNLDCPNHGNCENCTSRHLRIGTLNYCGFYAILPELEAAVAAAPDSPSADAIRARIDRQTGAYRALMEKHGISEAEQEQKRTERSNYSDH